MVVALLRLRWNGLGWDEMECCCCPIYRLRGGEVSDSGWSRCGLAGGGGAGGDGGVGGDFGGGGADGCRWRQRRLVWPVGGEFGSHLTHLSLNIVTMKDCLHRMCTGTTWKQSVSSEPKLGVDVQEIVLDPQFWLCSTRITSVSEALITVRRVADSKERPSIGYLYDAMGKAKKTIISAFANDESDYSQYLKVIEHAQEECHSPLHAAACYLNPSIYYNPGFSVTNMIQKGLLDCIETLEPDTAAQDNITRDKAYYEDAVGDFSRPMALRGRESLIPVMNCPATWWSQYASDYQDLQRFAVRILSQTCSMSSRSSKNRLERLRLNDTDYVQYNLGLQQSQSVAPGTKSLPR